MTLGVEVENGWSRAEYRVRDRMKEELGILMN
jgi:hypothetical protein